jgi:hypothetical protein
MSSIRHTSHLAQIFGKRLTNAAILHSSPYEEPDFVGDLCDLDD